MEALKDVSQIQKKGQVGLSRCLEGQMLTLLKFELELLMLWLAQVPIHF